MVDRHAEARKAVERGWALTPLRGKIPLLQDWPNLPRADWDTVDGWLTARFNLGVRTGASSGVIIIDVDTAKGATIPPGLPPTVTARTGTGGYHFYFYHVEGIRNSASKLAPNVDVRGDGGQCVFPGSIHPDTHKPYEWETGLSPDEIPIASLPRAVLDLLRAPTVRVDMTAPDAPGTGPHRLLLSQVAAVCNATEGSRNDTLNRAAYTLGGCIDLTELVVTEELLAAARIVGLPEREAKLTIQSGFHSGRLKPLRESAIKRLPMVADTTFVTPSTGEILTLIPGSHYISEERQQHVTTDTFSATCLALLPDGLICRRGGVPGQLQGERGRLVFEPLSINVARIIVDRYVRLAQLKPPDKNSVNDKPIVSHKYAVSDYGAIFLAGAQLSEYVPTLAAIVHWPTLLPDGSLTRPGWGEAGVYYDEPASLEGCEPIMDPAIREALLRDLIVDFPLASEGDIEAVWAMLLTPLVRIAIQGPAPLFLVSSPQERTGKTKLVELVLGMTTLGEPVAASQLGSNTEEHDKRIISLLLSGASIVHLDNLSDYLDSAPLASLLTSHQYQARVLGRSAVVTIPNHLTLVATGNNPRMSGELANRTVHIRLQTSQEDPARRVNFRHPDLPGWILGERTRLVGALLGMIQSWLDAGRPPGDVVLGGFEGWARVVGGILAHQAGLIGRQSRLLRDAPAYVREQDDPQADMRALVDGWLVRGGADRSASELLAIAQELGLFGWIDGKSIKSEQTKFGTWLAKCSGRIYSGWRLTTHGTGSRRVYSLDIVSA